MLKGLLVVSSEGMPAQTDVGCNSNIVYGKPSVDESAIPKFETSVEKNELGANTDQKEDWDAAKGVVGFYCRIVHSHYYIVALAWLCVCIAMTIVVLFGPSDERCVGPNGAPGQMQVCR